MTNASADLLETIVAATRRTVEVRRSTTPFRMLEEQARKRTPRGRAFSETLRSGEGFRVIAECKRRSPSRGVLRRDYAPSAIAAAYERAGAAAISVLTEPAFFDGALDHLEAVRQAVSIPILRKDFIVEEYQILEARARGADAALLIAAALHDEDLRRCLAACSAYGLASLVEVHDAGELERALEAGAEIVGVNSRNLRTLDVDLGLLDRLAPALPRGVIAVAESGLRTTSDLARLREAGYAAFLVGERLMTEPDPGRALSQLRGSESSCE
jgi:indole-3-glycerol phosphate synthase